MSYDPVQGLRDALAISPDNVPLRLHLAETLFQQLKTDDAEEEFKQVLYYDGKNESAKNGLARVYYRQKKYSTAIVVLEELYQQHPDNVEYATLLCKALVNDDSAEAAKKIYMKLIDRLPDYRDPELDGLFRNASVNPESDWEEEDTNVRWMENPGINFNDVGGMDDVKKEIEIKIIHPLKHPDLYKAYGKKTGGGILLFGPPGCGKTYLARATAGQIKARFINVGIHDILDMWMGKSEQNLHQLFETARRHAPCVLFFDEIDALGAHRTDMKQSAGRHLINQFLSELDGTEANNDGLLVLGATNAPWNLDPAFRRPGRFDRIIFVKPPDEEGRRKIMEAQLKGKPVENINEKELAAKAKEFSGADLKAVIDVAIEAKLEASMISGNPEPITQKDLLAAIKKVKPSTREWFSAARNYALYANESGLYDGILEYLDIKK